MLKKCFALLLGVSLLFFGCSNVMEMIQSIKDTSNPSTGGGGTPTGAFVISEKNAKIAQISLDAADMGNNTGTDKVYVWTTRGNGNQADTLGRNHSIQLATVPGARANSAVIKGDTSPYATYGDDGTKFGAQKDFAKVGSFRIPAINKVTLPNGKTRLIAAFDVRYRGAFNGGGDCNPDTNVETGVDGTVLYSDDGGDTWTPAVNKKTGKKPALDVENTNDGSKEAAGQTTKRHSPQNTLDICDPQVSVMPNGHIYVGVAAGSGNTATYSNFRVFRSTDYGETWEESPKSTADRTATNTFRSEWGQNYNNGVNGFPNSFKHVMTTPGHSIILKKDVPGSSSFKKGQAVMPIFHNCAQNGGNGYMYLATGSGVPEDWSTNNFSPDTCYNGSSNIEEGNVCQLDDGSLLLYSKLTGRGTTARFQRYTGSGWINNLNQPDPFTGGKDGQVSILKVADGDGVTKHGVVAFSYSGNSADNASDATQNKGRGNITVCFARDLSTKRNGTEHPLDDSEPYYIKIRTQGQSYFGYTDLVMIDDDTLGILFENYSSGANDIHGMRFARVNIRPIIDKLSQP